MADLNENQPMTEDLPRSPIARNVLFADPRRIDLDTVREVVVGQGLLSKTANEVIFSAEPIQTEASECEQQDGTTHLDASYPDICWQEVHLLVFLDEQAGVKLDVFSPSSLSMSRWFQKVLDAQLGEGRIDWNHLLGDLVISDTQTASVDMDILLPLGEKSEKLDWVTVADVQPEILAAVRQAQSHLLMQSQGLPDAGPAGCLTRAVLDAAHRGVECRMLWQALPQGVSPHASTSFPVHDNIEHRAASDTRELLVADEKRVLASLPWQIQSRNGSHATSVLRTTASSDRSVCRRTRQAFLEAWSSCDTMTFTGPSQTQIVGAAQAQRERGK